MVIRVDFDIGEEKQDLLVDAGFPQRRERAYQLNLKRTKGGRIAWINRLRS
jgi:hypothetical protein